MEQRIPPVSAAALLDWYDRHARNLPWRVLPGERARGVTPDPYRIWLSEVMLQQTTVTAVKAYYDAFIRAWPSVRHLAAADEHDVLRAWAGLGYYSRARNLKACADKVTGELGGRFPETEAGLRALPGIGPYTAAAIAAIAFDHPAVVVDGNVERVMARLHAIELPLPQAKGTVRQHTAALVPQTRPGDFAQAMMDLGATICSPRRPACPLCPWRDGCRAHALGAEESYPRKASRQPKPTRRGMAFVAVRSDGAVLLRRRPRKGLLGGMSEPPTTDWGPAAALDDVDQAPLPLHWRRCVAPVRHTFTHFHLEMAVWHAEASLDTPAPAGHWWSLRDDLSDEALPTVMRKALAVARATPGT